MSDRLSADQLDDLIARGEGAKIDWKQELNYTRSKYEEAEFVKDMLSLVNSEGAGSSYLIIGLEDKTGLPHDIGHLGILEQNLHQTIRERIEPRIRFTYQEYLYEGQTIGIVEIPRSRTRFHLAKTTIQKDKEVYLPKGAIYSRDGSNARLINAEDFMLLRGEIEEQARLDAERRVEPDRPNLAVSFADGTETILMKPVQPNNHWSNNLLTITPAIFVKNLGSAIARDVRVDISLNSSECYIEISNIVVMEHLSRYGFIHTLPKPIYQKGEAVSLQTWPLQLLTNEPIHLRWTAVCEGMKEPNSGMLQIKQIFDH